MWSKIGQLPLLCYCHSKKVKKKLSPTGDQVKTEFLIHMFECFETMNQ